METNSPNSHFVPQLFSFFLAVSREEDEQRCLIRSRPHFEVTFVQF